MKTIIASALISIASLSSAMAAQSFTCTSSPDQTGGWTSVTITIDNQDNATLKGFQSGGEAQFGRVIGPFNVEITHNADAVTYTNKEEKLELNVVTLGLNGKVISTASFDQGFGDDLSMTCKQAQ